jgi:TIR domain
VAKRGGDFFISYTSADEDWAEWIAWQLESAGYTTLIQAWDFRPGMNFVSEMQKGATECRRTIIVLSPQFINSKFTEAEWTSVFAKDPNGELGLLIPVRVAECKPPGLLHARIYIDLVGLSEEEARQRLFDGVRQGRAKPTSAPPLPVSSRTAPVFPGTNHNLPFPWAKVTPASLSTDLVFIPLPNQSFCAIDCDRSLTQIRAHWRVTNQSAAPMQLFTARLLKPHVRAPAAHCNVFTAKRGKRGDELFSDDHEIPPSETRKVSIHCFVSRKLRKPDKLLELTFAVTDGIGREHHLPAIQLQTIDMTAKK